MGLRKIIYASLLLASCNEATKNSDIPTLNTSNLHIHYPLTKSSDSLLMILKTVSDDTNKVNVLNKLGWSLMYSNIDTSFILGDQALILAEKLLGTAPKNSQSEWIIKKGLANAHANLGVYAQLKANNSMAIDHHMKALDIDKEIQNEKGIARDEINIGLVFWNQGDYPKALDHYLISLRIQEKRKNKDGIASALINIGNVYFNLGEYVKSLDHHSKALKIVEELNDQVMIASQLGNIALVYHEQGYKASKTSDSMNSAIYFQKAHDYYLESIEKEKKLNDLTGLATRYGNLSSLFSDLSYKYDLKSQKRKELTDSAKKYILNAIAIDEQIGNLHLKATNLGNLGALNMENGNYKDAYRYLYSALAIDDSLGALDYVKTWYEALSKLYETSVIPLPDTIGGTVLDPERMRLRSIHYYKRYISVRDTLFSQENKKQLVQKEMKFDFDKKAAALEAENEKKEALAAVQLKQKENERNYFIGGFVLVLLLAGYIFRSYKLKQKANILISEQKALVEEKQKEILDSIQYAKRIQRSLLPTEKYILKTFKRLNK